MMAPIFFSYYISQQNQCNHRADFTAIYFFTQLLGEDPENRFFSALLSELLSFSCLASEVDGANYITNPKRK
jgi:hypothetical protein